MIPEYRARFNSAFSNQKYAEVKDKIAMAAGEHAEFRLSESPVFLPESFKKKLNEACDSIIDQILMMPAHELEAAIPASCRVPGKYGKPHFLTIDFAISTDTGGAPEPQLIELQAFPSIYAFQKVLEQTFVEVYPFLEPLKSDLSTEEYFKKLKRVIVGDEDPENVILLEIFPERQKTRADFLLTEKFLGIKTVCLTKIQKEGRQLYYEDNGKKIPVHRIYNRVIFDELDAIPNLETQFDVRDDVDLTWVTHPNWFFMVSKFILPKLEHQYIPKSYFLKDFPATEDPADYVLKPLFSFAGSGVILHPSTAQLQAINDKENYIMQRKVQYAPLFKDINGEYSKAEIRMLYIWDENEDRPQLMENVLRMTKAEMANVDFNKKDAIWIGGSVGFFCK